MRSQFGFDCTAAGARAISPAHALERLIDISNDRWVEVTGEGSVSAAPDFAQVTLGVTSTGKTAGEAMAANAKAANALVSLIRARASLQPTSRPPRCRFRRCSRSPHPAKRPRRR